MAAHPSSTTALCVALEKAVNHALLHDPATRARTIKQAGRAVSLILVDPSISLTLTFTDQGVQLAPLALETADCTLSGKASGLFQLLNGPKNSLAQSELTLTGQTGFLMELLDIAKHIDIDWEAIICQYTGDIAGHVIAQGLRAKGEQIKRISQRSPAFLNNFIVEELRATPSAPELNAFNNHVDDLRDDADRLLARFERIKNSLNV